MNSGALIAHQLYAEKWHRWKELKEMKADSLFTKAAAGLSTVALALALSACSSHTKLAKGTDSGEIRTEQASQQQATSGNTIAEAPAPANTQGATITQTPAIISGPAKVDSTGRVYTSSSAGSTGNASGTGLNTNVNIIPEKSKSTVTVTETPAPIVSTTVVETTPPPAPPVVVVETPAPPAAVVVETPAPAPPMISSTTTTTQTTTTTTRHRRMRKD